MRTHVVVPELISANGQNWKDRRLDAMPTILQKLQSAPFTLVTDFKPSSQIYILDSSFNPPTISHLELGSYAGHNSLLLLLATQNADKPMQPASLEHRVKMMKLLAKSFHRCGIALTKHAYFVDKARAIENHYPDKKQTFIVGYDTLVRIFDRKYDADGDMELKLGCFFEHGHGLVSILRGADQNQQEHFSNNIPDRWREQIRFVPVLGDSTSSTAARNAIASKDWSELKALVPLDIANFIQTNNLYD